jgi:hypothetical protein
VGSADVKVQNIFHGQNNITCSTKCKYRTAATIYALETWFIHHHHHHHHHHHVHEALGVFHVP